jgi:uncharacterized protein
MEQQEQLKEYYRFEVDGRKFVYDVNDIVIFEVDDVIWDYYDAAEDPEVLPPRERLTRLYGTEVAEDVVDELREMGLLGPVKQPSQPTTPLKQVFHGVTLNVTHGCNLRCTYCFAQQGDYGLGESRMDVETAKKAIDWLAEQGDGEKSTRVGFFGGEPLMKMNTIRDTVDYAGERLGGEGKRVNYHVTTNGTLLNDKNVKFLAETKNMDVQVSIDGLPKVNDAFRIFPNGRGSHDVVAKGIERLKAATGKAVLRGTISPGEAQFSDSVRHMVDDLGGTVVAFEPASGSTTCGQSIDADEMQKIKAEWEKVANYFAEHIKQGEIKPVGNLIKLLIQIHRRKKSVYGCTAGHSNVAIDPSGDIYPCHRFVGESEWKMGNIHDGTFDDSISQQFANNTVDNRDPCKSCWVRYTCGGRCAHEAMEATGKITNPDPIRCDLVRHMTELALKLYVRLKPYERELVATGVKGT